MLRPSRSAVLWMPGGKLCLQSPPPVAEPASVPLTCAWRRGTLDGRGVRRREPGRSSMGTSTTMLARRLAGSLPLVVLAAGAGAQQHAAPMAMTDEDMIKSAMAAAPEAVAAAAAIVALEADGNMRILRRGSNGFTCLPDNPNSPGPDPMCGDTNAMKWAAAWIGKKEPPAGTVGVMYMLAGGAAPGHTQAPP